MAIITKICPLICRGMPLTSTDKIIMGVLNLGCTYPQVRANSLQELVYKQGQAGVTKATVSIVFNNSDKANGPVEYQHLDQITVTRQVHTHPFNFVSTSSQHPAFLSCSASCQDSWSAQNMLSFAFHVQSCCINC